MASTLIAMSKRSLGLADGGNEDDSYGSDLANDGKKPPPSKGMAEVEFDANSVMAAEVGQKPRGEQKAAMKDNKTAKKIRGESKMQLTGTLLYSDKNGERRHIIRGQWRLKPGKAHFQQSFELYRVLHPFELPEILPMSDMYKASFVKGDITGSSFIAEECNVDLSFILEKDDANSFSVVGEGGDRFGIFKLEGTATKKSNNPVSFAINMEKMYIPQNPIMPTAMADTSIVAFERPTGIADGGDQGSPPKSKLDVTAAAAANNEATVPVATVEAPNSSTAIATATLEPPATNATTDKADAPEKGALFLIETDRKAAADLKEEEENANDDRKRHSKNVRVGSKSAALPHYRRFREKQSAQKQGGEGTVMDAMRERKKAEDLRDAKTDFPNGEGEDSTPNPKLVDDGEELSRPNHAKSTMVEVGQYLHEDNTTPPSATAAGSVMSGSGLEIIEDDDGPLIPPAFSTIPFDGDSRNHDAMRTAGSRCVGKSAKARPEIMLDNTGLAPPLVEMEFTDSKKTEPIVTRPPRPTNIAEIGDEEDALKKGQPPPRQQIAREDSIVSPPSEDMDDDDLRIHTNRRGGRAEEFIVNANVAPSNPGVRGDEDEEANVQHGNPEDASASLDLERDSMFKVPEAVLVEEVDDEVYMGEPIGPPLPWWKQRRMRFLLCLMFVIVAISAITSGFSLSSEEAIRMVARTNAPSISTVPSSFPTLKSSQAPSTSVFPSVTPTGAPSVSINPTSSPSDEPSSMPSSPPSACVAKIGANLQKIDLSIDDPRNPAVEVDGKNAVVVVRDGDCCEGNPAYVIFYSLKAIVGWLPVNTFLIDDLGDHLDYEVALSGKTAFVGFEWANDDVGAVLVFEQNQFGSWEKVEDPFVHVSATSHCLFGLSVGIDGGLAFVADWNNVYMFRRGSNGKWVEFDRVHVHGGGADHTISGDVIAAENNREGPTQLYKYMPDLDKVLPIQDPIRTGDVSSIDLMKDYLVYWEKGERAAFIYRREEANQTFAFLQRLNITGPRYNSLALDSDILVVGSISSTHIFSEQDGNWEETITLDKRYNSYALSGRQLLAATWTEVHAFDIQDCAQEMPTQTPSSSQMPSSNPTTLPSTSPSPSIAPSSSVSPSTSPSSSMAPSSSTSPTETCYWLTIAIDYDEKPEDTFWKLYRAVGNGWETLKYHYASAGDTSYSESICLEEGEYRFNIYDSPGKDGICCDHGEGSYNVTDDGTLIVEGGEFGRYEETFFSLPFVAGTNVTTQYD